MKPIFLAIFFVINGDFYLVSGHYPRAYPNMEVCDERRVFTNNYFTTLKDRGILEADSVHTMCAAQEEVEEFVRENLNQNIDLTYK